MSEENVELARSWFERWNRGERAFSEDEVDPELELVSRFQVEPFRGPDGLSRWIREIDDQFEEWQVIVDDWRDTGDRVVALGHVHMRGAGSGVQLDQPIGWTIEISEGKLRHLKFFDDPAEALEAAGLSE